MPVIIPRPIRLRRADFPLQVYHIDLSTDEYAMKSGAKLSPYLFQACLDWIYEGRMSGGWFRSVLENNLKRAVTEADPEYFQQLPHLIRWLYSYAPAPCWGTPEKVEWWKEAEREPAPEDDDA